MAMPVEVAAAAARLAGYNTDAVSPENPLGFDDGGYIYNLQAMNTDASVVANWLAEAVEPIADLDEEIADLAAVRSELEALGPRAGDVSTLADLATQLAALGSITAALLANADIDEAIVIVSGINSAVTIAAAMQAQLLAISEHQEEYLELASKLTQVQGVYNARAAVLAVYPKLAAVESVSVVLAAIGAVDEVITSGEFAAVAAVAPQLTEALAAVEAVNDVLDFKDEVIIVSGMGEAVPVVAEAVDAVQTNADNIAAILSAAANATAYTTLLANATPLNSVATNLTAILAAQGYAETAQTHAEAAGSYAAQVRRSGVAFAYSDTTTDSDPGESVFRLNDVDASAATQMFISEESVSGSAAGWIDTWDDSTTASNRGTLVIMDATDFANYWQFRVTGAVTDAGDYRKVPVAFISAGGAMPNDALCIFDFVRSGDTGDGDGDVNGPGSVTPGRIAVFADGSGKLIEEGGDWMLSGQTETKTENYTVLAADKRKTLLANKATSINFALTAAASMSGVHLLVKNIGAGVLTIDPDGSETIDGALTLVLQSGQSATLYCDGTAWLTYLQSQFVSALIASIQSQSWAENQIMVLTGSDSVEPKTFTPAAQNLVNKSSIGDMREYLQIPPIDWTVIES